MDSSTERSSTADQHGTGTPSKKRKVLTNKGRLQLLDILLVLLWFCNLFSFYLKSRLLCSILELSLRFFCAHV